MKSFQEIINDHEYLKYKNNLFLKNDCYKCLSHIEECTDYIDTSYQYILFDLKNYNKDFYKIIAENNINGDCSVIDIWAISYCKIYDNYFKLETYDIFNDKAKDYYLYNSYLNKTEYKLNSYIELFFNDPDKFIHNLKQDYVNQYKYLHCLKYQISTLYPYITDEHNKEEYHMMCIDLYKFKYKVYYNYDFFKVLNVEIY